MAFSKKKKVSAIIPIFDEEKNIAKLLEFLLGTSIFYEIICVNDGSTDKSLDILKEFKKNIKIVNFRKNYGKGHALAGGIKKANGEIVVFLDADLINLTQKHLKKLILPILKGEKKAVLGYGTPRRNHFFASHPLVQMVTGQRAYEKKSLMPYLGKIAKTRYGVEIFLSSLFPKEDIVSIPLIKLTHIWKHKKHKPQKAIKQYIQMGAEVATEFGKQKIKSNFNLLSRSANLELFKEIAEEITTEIKELSADIKDLKDKNITMEKLKYYYEKISNLGF